MTIPNLDYAKETDRIVGFIKKTIQATGKTKAVIALSGGIDSATSFILTQRALGNEALLPLHLPSRSTDPKNTQDVLALLKSVNFPQERLTTIPIASIIQKAWRIVKHNAPTPHSPKVSPDRKSQNTKTTALNRLRLANLAARIRMSLIFDHAKRHNALVIGTENLSEHLLGYYTRYGDEASDLEPIRHLYKTQVIDLAKHLNIPASIIQKAPSADLWAGQSDETELGFSYAAADPILHLHLHGDSVKSIVDQGFDQKIVEKVLATVEKNRFKHQVPYTLQF